jgi:hypothetical protein
MIEVLMITLSCWAFGLLGWYICKIQLMPRLIAAEADVRNYEKYFREHPKAHPVPPRCRIHIASYGVI